MEKRIQFLIILSMVVAALLAGCAGKSATPGVVPDSLHGIEAAAEDIIDLAPGGDWGKISSDTSGIADAWMAYPSQAVKDGAPQAVLDSLSGALSQLQSAVAAKDTAGTMQSANDLSAAVVELFAIYNPAVPADIGRLDVLERQVILDVTANDYAAVTTTLAKVKSVWENVQASVLNHSGKDAAAQFNASIATQENALKARNGAALTDEAKNGLEIVDALEKLY
jgi:hypothetical protein